MTEAESLEGHYFELRGKLSTGAITPEEYRSQVARLWFEDANGHTWMIGAQTGHWYVYQNDQWTMSDPPRDHAPQVSITCPRCGETVDAKAQFCGHCGYRLIEPEPAAVEHVGLAPAPTLERTASAPTLQLSAPTPALRLKNDAKTVSASVRSSSGPSRNLILAITGAALFGVLFLCLGTVGGLLLLRNSIASPVIASAATASASRVTATPARSPTPAPTTLALADRSPTTSPTPLVVASIAAQVSANVPTPIVVIIETSTPTETPAPETETPTAAPTATPTETQPPTDTPVPVDTDTATPVPPTDTPRPPTATPVPRPPTATPAPAAVLSGHIVFTVFNIGYRERPAYDVFMSSPDGSNKQVIAPRRRQPQFSPDGNRLITMGMENDKEKLWVRDLVSGAERAINNTPVEAMQPSWSPEGNSVLYASTELADRQSRLFVVDARGAPETRPWLKTGSTDLIGRFPTWMTNGQIVYTGCDKWANTGQCGIIRVNPDGQAPVMLTANARDGIDLAPSGRGNTVVFMSDRDGNWQIYTMPLAGDGQARNISNAPGDNGLPTISPDGQFIAFVSNRSGQWAVWAMRLDGSGQRLLFNLDGGYATGSNVDWTTERISWGP
jgi:hypothetical protein